MEKKITYSALQDMLDSAQNRMNLLVDQCAKDEQTIEALQEENCNLKEANERLQIAAIDAKNSRDKLKRAYESLRKECELFKDTISNVKEENRKLQFANEQLQKEIAGRSKTYREMQSEIKELNRVKVNLQREVFDLKNGSGPKQETLIKEIKELKLTNLGLYLSLEGEKAISSTLREMIIAKTITDINLS